MKKFIRLFVALLSFSAATPLHAQNKNITITGRVISFEESLGLEGVSITVKGSNFNTGTHADGTFSLSVDSGGQTLVFSLQDYQTTELKLDESGRDYEVVLKRNTSDRSTAAIIKELVFPDAVTGYLVAIGE